VAEGEGASFLDWERIREDVFCYLFLGNKRRAVIESFIHCCFSDCRQVVTRVAWKVH
jgi:hypothetical protein